MRAEAAASYSSKYSSPFAAFLDRCTLEGFQESQLGDACDGPGMVIHVGGAHVLHYSTDGFVTHYRMDPSYRTFTEWAVAMVPEVTEWEQAMNGEVMA